VLVVGCLAAPLAAEPSSPSYITPQQGRSIADPNNLAPPRHGSPATSMAAPPDAPAVSLDLNRAITTVLEKSPTVERVMSRIRQAEYKVEEAYTMANPTVSFTTQYTRVEPGLTVPNIGTINPTDNYQFSLNIRQAIYTFGRMKWTALAAKLQQRVVEEEYRTEINRLVELTAQRYIEALLSQDAVSIALDNLEAQQANLRTSQLLYDQGVAARFDVLSNSAAVARAEQRLLEARTAEANAKARLLSLLDEPLDRSLRLEALDLYAPQQIALPDAKQRALESRPDLRSVRWAVEEAKARVEVAETSNNPTLELQNTTINRNAAGFAPGTQNTTALVLNVPLYDGGVSHFQAEQAKEAVTQLSKGLEQSERDVVLQVEEVYNQLIDRWLAISVAEENVRQADEALRVAVLRYQNGISTNVELLDSQANRSQAHYDLATSRAQYLLSRWAWWQVTASEYPTEVPFPADIRARLDAEGVPLRPATREFSEQPAEGRIGPFLPVEEAPRLPIRGLPTAPGQGSQTSDGVNASSVQPLTPTAPAETAPAEAEPTQPVETVPTEGQPSSPSAPQEGQPTPPTTP
jgi:outer membrane protein